ncbi:MAG: AbrB/MazE/SpoVT family DNA-binding domain-containing protein [Gemmatimonadota bacterium]|nr:AbrB/MazE/SpoVT family DNA-binding domain-containing protein [Gemmatimonadota bacterium]
MIKKLAKHGNSLALVIDKSILELLKIDADSPLEITTDGRGLFILPVRGEKDWAEFEEALEKTNEKYGEMLKRLAR